MAGESEPSIQHEPTEPVKQRGLLFTGERLQTLTADELAWLGERASMLGVQMYVVDDVRKLGKLVLAGAETSEPEPVLVDAQDIRTFAAEHGFSKSLASRVCASLNWLAGAHAFGREDDLPPFGVFHEAGSHVEAIDLRALYAHLYPAMSQRGFFSGSPKQDALWVAMVNALVQPEQPVPSKRVSRQQPA